MVIQEKDNRIDVICQFTRSTDLIPMRIRTTDEYGMRQTYNITWFREISMSGNVRENGTKDQPHLRIFICHIQSFGKEISIRISYNSRDQLWRLVNVE